LFFGVTGSVIAKSGLKNDLGSEESRLEALRACNGNKREGKLILSGASATLEASDSVPGLPSGVVSIEDSLWAGGG